MLRRIAAVTIACALALACTPRHAAATRLAVDVWLDRGDAAVYQPGEALNIRSKVSEDAYLLVYEIDSEGNVNLLYPMAGRSGYAEGRRELRIPPDDSHLDLVAQDPVGEGYVVAIASSVPFHDLPWYLRPYDAQAEGVGYHGDTPPEEQGVTADGQIVGDPFVAMEKIRRRVLEHPEDETAFATSYSTYYIHERVKYPRYLCDDCHRPAHWSWWPGYDPYFTSCSAFDFRANWGWYWGPSYWNGCVPYYVFIPRSDGPPGIATGPGITYSSWLGWNKWTALWGGKLDHVATNVPSGYVSPDRYRDGRTAASQGGFRPPGYVAADQTSPLLRSSRGLTFGRFTDAGSGGGMSSAHGSGSGTGTRSAAPQRFGDGQGRSDGGLSHSGERGARSGGGITRAPDRGATPEPRRFETPQRSSQPQRSVEPQRYVAPEPRRAEAPARDSHPAPRTVSPPSAPAPSTPPPAPAPAPAPASGGDGKAHEISGGHHH